MGEREGEDWKGMIKGVAKREASERDGEVRERLVEGVAEREVCNCCWKILN